MKAIARNGGSITPPLNIADADLDDLLAIVADSVRAVTTSS